jgi:hypothetical protein
VILSAFASYLDMPPLPPRSSGLARRRSSGLLCGRKARGECVGRLAVGMLFAWRQKYASAIPARSGYQGGSGPCVLHRRVLRQRKDRNFAVAKGVEDVAIDRSLLNQAELNRKAK